MDRRVRLESVPFAWSHFVVGGASLFCMELMLFLWSQSILRGATLYGASDLYGVDLRGVKSSPMEPTLFV